MNGLYEAWRRSRGKRRLLLEASAELLRAIGQLRCVPFRKLAPRLGTLGLESSAEHDTAESARAQEVRWAIQAVARRLTGICTCLVMAMAAQKMLARRGLPYILYLGVSRAEGSLAAHAWLRCGDVCVTGETGKSHFTLIASFGRMPSEEPLHRNDPPCSRGTHLPPQAI